jgi:hypothetical protein
MQCTMTAFCIKPIVSHAGRLTRLQTPLACMRTPSCVHSILSAHRTAALVAICTASMAIPGGSRSISSSILVNEHGGRQMPYTQTLQGNGHVAVRLQQHTTESTERAHCCCRANSWPYHSPTHMFGWRRLPSRLASLINSSTISCNP